MDDRNDALIPDLHIGVPSLRVEAPMSRLRDSVIVLYWDRWSWSCAALTWDSSERHSICGDLRDEVEDREEMVEELGAERIAVPAWEYQQVDDQHAWRTVEEVEGIWFGCMPESIF